jgi:LuxR family transcriptional regulator, quorum-sensing system regulator BjaR1
MPASTIALDFLDYCEKETSADAIGDRFISTLQAIGYEYIACSSHLDPLRPRPGGVRVLNYPKAWVEHYSEEEFARIDPVFHAACAMPGPFSWDDALAKMRLSRDQKRVLAEGAAYGLSRGMTIPLRSPDIIPASCSLVAGPDGIDPLSLAHTLMVVIYGHGAMHRRLNPDMIIEPVVLPRRERQCLTLAGCGKSDWVIGELLGISGRTAHNSIERAKKRYDVSHRIQAVVRAVFNGQIMIDDLSG